MLLKPVLFEEQNTVKKTLSEAQAMAKSHKYIIIKEIWE
jgi:hypothetical protein